jgi:endo-1,4-beta-xylanase
MYKNIYLFIISIVLFLWLFPTNSCADNLLINPGFEDGIVGWSSQGGCSIESSSQQSHTGAYSGKASNRSETWQGIQQSLLGKVENGHTYRISGWVRLENTDSNSIGMTIRQVDDSGTRYIPMQWSTGYDTHWEQLSGYFTLDINGSLTTLDVYFEGPSAGINLYVDDAVVEDVGNWKNQANQRIEQFRKTDLQITAISPAGEPLPNVEVQIRQVKHHFAFGSAISSWHIDNPNYTNFFKDHFEWAVMENASKWYTNEYHQGNVTYERADAIVEFCQANDITMRGHCIYWAVDQFVQDWIQSLEPDALLAAVENRMDSAVHHFKNKFVHWDVNNEMLHGTFYQDRLGESIRPWMFQAAHAIDPNCRLFVNDYNVVSGSETETYKTHILDLIDRGAPIHGIGAQCHMWGSAIEPYQVFDRLDSLAELGLPIWCSEYDFADPNEHDRAAALEDFYRIAFSHPAVEGILMWGFWENAHWRDDSHIVNADWTLNEAGRRYEALLQEWTTNAVSTTDVNGVATFRPFYGTYEVILSLPGVIPTITTISIAPDSGPTQFTLPLNDPVDCVEVHALGLHLPGDLKPDCIIDAVDLSLFVPDWAQCNNPANPNCQAIGFPLIADLNFDQRVDLRDYYLIANDWLQCNDPQIPSCQSYSF